MPLISNRYRAVAPYGFSLPPLKAVVMFASALLVIHILAKSALNQLTSAPQIQESDFRQERAAPYKQVVTEETGAQLDNIKAVDVLYKFGAVGSALIPMWMNPAYAAFYIASLMLFTRFVAAPVSDDLINKLPLSAGTGNFTDKEIIADTQRFNAAGQPIPPLPLGYHLPVLPLHHRSFDSE